MQFKKGDKVKIVNNTSGHQMPMGTTMTVTGYNQQFVRVKENALNYYEVDLEFIAIKLADVQKNMERSETEYLKNLAKLEYMKETGVPELVEKDFRIYTIQKVLASKMSLEDKAKKIDAVYQSDY